MQIQKSAIIDTLTRRLVEMTFADQSKLEDASEFVSFRIPVAQTGHPRIPEVQLEALDRARSIIDVEIARLEALRAQEL